MRGGGEAFSPQTSTHIQPPHHRRHCCRCPHCFPADLENPNQLPNTCASPDLPVREAQNSPMGDLNPRSHARSAPAFFLLLLLLLLRVKPARDEVRSGGDGSRKRPNCSKFPASKMRNNNPERSDAARLPHLHAACLALARLGCPCSAASTPPLGPYHCRPGGERNKSIKRLNF